MELIVHPAPQLQASCRETIWNCIRPYATHPSINIVIMALAFVGLQLECPERRSKHPSPLIGLPVSVIAVTGLYQIYQLLTIRRIFILRMEEENGVPPNNDFSRRCCLINDYSTNAMVSSIFSLATFLLSFSFLMYQTNEYTDCSKDAVIASALTVPITIINLFYSQSLSADMNHAEIKALVVWHAHNGMQNLIQI